jgi:DNA-binding ferritin-like protein
MTSSNLDQIFQTAASAPTEEVITEEVVIVKEANVENLIFKMVELASYLYHLNIQAHLIHLNLEAPNFLELHKFLKKQYVQHTADFDELSELVRSMDFLLPMCQKGLLGAYKGFKTTKTYDSVASLTLYTKNLEAGGMMTKDVYDMAKEVGAPDIENKLAEICGNMFKSAWKLKSSLR